MEEKRKNNNDDTAATTPTTTPTAAAEKKVAVWVNVDRDPSNNNVCRVRTTAKLVSGAALKEIVNYSAAAAGRGVVSSSSRSLSPRWSLASFSTISKQLKVLKEG